MQGGLFFVSMLQQFSHFINWMIGDVVQYLCEPAMRIYKKGLAFNTVHPLPDGHLEIGVRVGSFSFTNWVKIKLLEDTPMSDEGYIGVECFYEKEGMNEEDLGDSENRQEWIYLRKSLKMLSVITIWSFYCTTGTSMILTSDLETRIMIHYCFIR